MILVETLHTIVILFNGICFKIDCYLYTKHILSYFWFVFGSFFFSLCYWFQFDFSTWPERAIACSKIVFIVNVLLIAFAFAFSVILNWISSTLVILSKRHSFNVYTQKVKHTRARNDQTMDCGKIQKTNFVLCVCRKMFFAFYSLSYLRKPYKSSFHVVTYYVYFAPDPNIHNTPFVILFTQKQNQKSVPTVYISHS